MQQGEEHKTTNLYHVVKGQPGKDDIREKFCYTEDAIDHPVGQPLCIIVFVGAFDCLDTEREILKSKPSLNLTPLLLQNISTLSALK